jgi:hypothetical protein
VLSASQIHAPWRRMPADGTENRVACSCALRHAGGDAVRERWARRACEKAIRAGRGDRGCSAPEGFLRRRVTAETLEVARRGRRSETLPCSSIGAVGSGALRPRTSSSVSADALIPPPLALPLRLPRSGCDGTATGDVPKRVAESDVSALRLAAGRRVVLSANRGSDVDTEPGNDEAAGTPAEEPSTLDSGEGWNRGVICSNLVWSVGRLVARFVSKCWLLQIGCSAGWDTHDLRGWALGPTQRRSLPRSLRSPSQVGLDQAQSEAAAPLV